jgi:hypothetical protein
VKRFTKDFSLISIKTGYFKNGVEYFDHIEICFANNNELKTIYFDVQNDDSKHNVQSFTNAAIRKFGQKSTVYKNGEE